MNVTNVPKGEVIQNLKFLQDDSSIHSLSFLIVEEFFLGSIDALFAVAKCFEYEYNAVERFLALYRGPPEAGEVLLEEREAAGCCVVVPVDHLRRRVCLGCVFFG